MKTSIIEVNDMLSVLTVDEVEKRFGEVPGVESATVNYAARNATVRYDETLLDVADIKILVHQRGQHSAGESQAKAVGEDKREQKPAQKPEQKSGVNLMPEAAPASASPPELAMPKAAPVAPASTPKAAAPASEGPPGKEAPATPHQHP